MKKKLLPVIFISIITMMTIEKVFAVFDFTVCDVRELKGTINWINVTDCNPNETEKCIFKKGQNVTIRISFTPNQNISSLKVKITGKVYGLSIPWSVSPDNACNYGLNCPIIKDQSNNFTMTMPISTRYPSVWVTIKLRLQDSDGNKFVCIQFPAKLEN